MKNRNPPQNKGYSEAGASYQKRALKGMLPNSGAPYEDIDNNNFTLRQRARMLYMSSPVAASAIRTARTNIVGPGLKFKAAINREVLKMSQEEAESWQKRTESEFELWAKNKFACDATSVNDFYEMQQLVLLSWLLSGDVFVLTKQYTRTAMYPYGLRLHILEADRVRTPTSMAVTTMPTWTVGKTKDGNIIHDGVEINQNGQIVAYHIANTYPYEAIATPTDFVRVPAYGKHTGLPNILHIMDSERPEQYRGVPYLAKVIEPLLQMRRYTEAEIMAAIVQAFFTVFITSENTSETPWNESVPDEVSDNENEYEMGPGTVNMLKPGQDVRFGAPTHPNSGFDVFQRTMAEQVGAGLEIPADLLLKSFNSSYSASRAALLEAWKSFKTYRDWLANDFCNPTYEIWLSEAIALGRISAPGFFTDPLIRHAYLGCQWIGAPAGQLDPTKEISAAVMAIENGLSTREAETIKLNGGQFAINAEKLKSENAKLQELKGE